MLSVAMASFARPCNFPGNQQTRRRRSLTSAPLSTRPRRLQRGLPRSDAAPSPAQRADPLSHLELSRPGVSRARTVGSPLARYVFTISPGAIAPKGLPRVLSALDTLWLEPIVPSYYCTALSDSVPEFVPAPALDANELAHVRISTRSMRARATARPGCSISSSIRHWWRERPRRRRRSTQPR